MMLHYDLPTKYSGLPANGKILPEYPRPQLRRDSYLNLNGAWDCEINKTGSVPAQFTQKINVPYPVESALSGICRTFAPGETIVYARDFDVPADFLKAITLLHFDAVDNFCRVLVNGQPAGEHTGGYLPFVLDVSDCITAGKNHIVVMVRDGTDTRYPIGKQSRKRGGIWYTPVSGIWQSVWLESVDREYIASLTITPDLAANTVRFEVSSASPAVQLTVYEGDSVIYTGSTDKGERTVSISHPHEWSPEDPFLYQVKLVAGRDSVQSYFAMRSFTTDGKRFLLNGKPYFVNGLLDQGYFCDGIYTPGSYEAYADDIRAMKELGFNTLRKHIKIEPMLFYYFCDTMGMLVLQDMVNTGKYSFFKDSVLPFAGLRSFRPYVNAGQQTRKSFIQNAVGTVRYLHNCPCVVYYTIFNEGWGQFDGDGLYRLLKKEDPTRVYDATSGWFREKLSDVDSRHIYFKPIRIKKSRKTLIISEFGGYSFICPGHVFNPEKNFGYKQFFNMEELERAFLALYENEVLGNLQNGLAGAIYTQVSDVEDETNGILTYDRKICKLHKEKVLPLMKKIDSTFRQYTSVRKQRF